MPHFNAAFKALYFFLALTNAIIIPMRNIVDEIRILANKHYFFFWVDFEATKSSSSGSSMKRLITEPDWPLVPGTLKLISIMIKQCRYIHFEVKNSFRYFILLIASFSLCEKKIVKLLSLFFYYHDNGH